MRISDLEIDEGIYDQHIFKAVFMAGAPGSGKSTVARRLFGATGLKSVNVDTIENFYRATQRQADRGSMRDKKNKQRDMYMSGRLGIVIDGTGRVPEMIVQTKKMLESLGYETAMVFVDVSEETTLKRASGRENDPSSPDYGRRINPDAVRNMHSQVAKAKKILAGQFQRFWSIDNNEGRPDFGQSERQINRWLNQKPESEIAQKWIRDQESSRTRASRTS